MKSDLYKTIKIVIENEKLDLESVIDKELDNKNIYLELLMTPDLLSYLINTTELDPFDHFYLIYKFTGKFNVKDNRILEKCKEYFKYKDLRSVISKIFKLYNYKYSDDTSKINIRKLKFITKEDLPQEFTKIGYLNLRHYVKNIKPEDKITNNEIVDLFINKSFKNKFYDHKDEEVRIQNFINDPNRNIEEFIKKNFYIENIYNIDYLLQNIDFKVSDHKVSNYKVSNDKISDDKISDFKVSNYKISNDKVSNNKVSDDKISNDKISNDKVSDHKISNDLLKFLLLHDNENVRYLGYLLFRHDSSFLNNLLFDKSKMIRNGFVNLYKFINLDLDAILEKRVNQETLFKYLKEKDILNYEEINILNINEKNKEIYKENCKLVKLYLSDNICDQKSEDSKDFRLLEYFKCKNISKLVDILINETDLKYILRIEKYLSELFINSDTYDYPLLIEKTFKTIPFVNIRKSGGLSVICKCILKNKTRRKENLKLICDKLEIKLEGFMKNIHTFNIFIEIYRKYQIINDAEGIKIVLRNIDKEDFVVKNMCIKMFEIIYKRESALNLEYLDTEHFKDDALFLFLSLAEFNSIDITNIQYKGNNVLIKSKLNELKKI